MRRTLFVLAAVAFFAAAAWYRPGDAGHAMGLLSANGGKARHPVQLPSGGDRYTLVVTGTVLPPYRGDARVVVEGEPALPYEVLAGAQPIVDLGVRRHPGFRDATLTGLQPRDHFTLWVVIRRPPPDPACPHTLHAPAGRYDLAFYDTATNNSVMRIPLVFGESTGVEGGHHHEG